jgi:uncharacterized coiled-coil DUF342 family protein
MKTSFQEADEIKDSRDKEFLNQFERIKEVQRERDERTRQLSEQFEKNFMKTSFQEADELRDSRDRDFLERWEKYKENGKKRSMKDTLLGSFDKLSENEQDEYFTDV